jgi:ABC-type branched-subunit amino acid transport system ATPase component
MTGGLLEIRALDAGYGKVRVVRGLSFYVRPGEVVALLGPNGAGKTTTLLTIAGELAPLGGTIDFLGVRSNAPLHDRVRRGLGFVGEERSVVRSLTLAENLRVSRAREEAAVELFPELEPHLDRKVGLLSGGQQQMLALARVLARPTPTRLLLADELSLGLAPLVVDRLLAAVRAAADDGAGVLLVEQHVHKAMSIADRVIVLNRGELQMQGSVDELRDRVEDIRASYLSGSTTATF